MTRAHAMLKLHASFKLHGSNRLCNSFSPVACMAYEGLALGLEIHA